MSDLLGLVFGVCFAALAARLVVGWVRGARWRPVGDGDLVAVLRSNRPRVPARTACAVVDLSSGTDSVQRAFNACDGQDVFEIGSVTKALTGLLVADAIERDEVAADSSLQECLPELSGTEAGAVTLAEVAHHRSGLPSAPLGRAAAARVLLNVYLGLDPYRGLDEQAVLGIAGRVSRRGVGAERYSNLGAALAGHAIARVAGGSYAQLLEERITAPLSMTSTSADPKAPRRSGRGWLGCWAQSWRLDGYAAAGSVTSNLDDLVLLLRALLVDGSPGGAALQTGLFWQIHTTEQGRRRIWHNGETGGYSAYLAVYPESRMGVVVLAAHAKAAEQERLAAACVSASTRR